MLLHTFSLAYLTRSSPAGSRLSTICWYCYLRAPTLKAEIHLAAQDLCRCSSACASLIPTTHLKGIVAASAGLQRGSATANGTPLGQHRASSREAGLMSASAAPSPPISVRGTASEEGFAASEGQMKCAHTHAACICTTLGRTGEGCNSLAGKSGPSLHRSLHETQCKQQFQRCVCDIL